MDPKRSAAAEMFDRIQAEVRKWMKGFSETDVLAYARGEWVPHVDMALEAGAARILADLPGLGPDDVSISLKGDELVFSGEKPCRAGSEALAISERKCGPFKRAIALPFRPDPSTVSAVMKNGVLEIRLSRLSSDAAGEVKIKVS